MKSNFNENIDRKIEQLLKNETDNISIPEDSFYRIKSGILKEKERGMFNMNFRLLKPKKVVIIGLVCLAVIGSVGVGASKGLFWSGSSDIRNEVTEFPTEKLVENRVGFVPKYVESFSNEFKFKSFNSSTQNLKNDNKDVIVSTKSACFQYKKEGSAKNQDLDFSAEKVEDQYIETKEFYDAPIEYNGVKIYYSSYKYKAVPDGYKVTDDEQKMISEGKLQIGYGDPSIEQSEDNIQEVSWYEDGIEYTIMNWNYDDISKDQMIDMAKQVIDK